ncbi:MAG: xanthine dehydrogenase family protein molybdopterin-binding subunit [Enhydrobacter sp.]|nr:xanthine dehydrogenase family protein molybdopterin-binding subunit [Enhydrobacter sp.]
MPDDVRLLIGRGCYVDDLVLPNQARGIILRSPHVHARIVSIDTSVASSMPGVLLILTGADIATDKLKPIPLMPHALSPPDIALYNLDGSDLLVERPMALATEAVRHVGEAVAFIVAETVAQAKDAAEVITVVYEPLPPISVIAVDARTGQPPATRAGFAEAEHVVQLSVAIPRDAGASVEPRGAIATSDAMTGRYALDIGGGAVARPKELAWVLGVEPEQVRVTTCEAGIGQGPRSYVDPEVVLVAWAARKLNRPVKWICERGDACAGDDVGACIEIEAELAVSADGRFLGLHGTNTCDVGAYTVSYVPVTRSTELTTSLYRLPAVVRARAIMSNTAADIRRYGIRAPETLLLMERMIDLAARETGIDRVELRRRNLIAALPHRNIFGVTYDAGDYTGSLDEALCLSDWDGFSERVRRSAARGLARGRGLAAHVHSEAAFDSTAPAAYASGWQVCEVEIDPETGEVRIDRLTLVDEAQGAPAALVNAIVDALSDYGVTHVEMPCTSEQVWRAIRGLPDR